MTFGGMMTSIVMKIFYMTIAKSTNKNFFNGRRTDKMSDYYSKYRYAEILKKQMRK